MNDAEVRREGGSLRCRLLGHRYIQVRDTTRGDPGYYRPYRYCRRCKRKEYMIDECVRDDSKWAAIQVEKHLSSAYDDGVYFGVVESGDVPERLLPTDERLHRSVGDALVTLSGTGFDSYEIVKYEQTGLEDGYIMERINDE